MGRRYGVTLVEVLVAIFVMGIGMIALLTLFPLGALTMAQAIKDDRAAHAAANAAACSGVWQLKKNSAYHPNEYSAPSAPSGLGALTSGRSYPIYVDPIGFFSYGAPANQLVAGQATSIPRYAPTGAGPIANPINSYVRSLRWCRLLDDLAFPDDGVPTATTERLGRYTWAYMFRLPNISNVNQIEMTIVIYNGRSVSSAAAGLPSGETQFSATFPSRNLIQITFTPGNKPAIRRGSWILDDTMTPSPPQGYFYRVVNVTDIGPGVIEVETQTPLRRFGGGISGTVVVMENVAEVIERGVD